MNFRASRVLVVALIGGSILFNTACTQSQETQVLNDIEAVVSLAGTGLSVAQSFGALDTPSEQADVTRYEAYAQALSKGASASITEWNSSDPLDHKIATITLDMTSVAPIGPVTNAKISAAAQALTAAVDLLIAQLSGIQAAQPAAPVAAAAAKAVTTSAPKEHADHVLFYALQRTLPWTKTHRLHVIQAKADANVALAQKLLAKK